MHRWHAYRTRGQVCGSKTCIQPVASIMAVSVCRACGKSCMSVRSAGSARAMLSRHRREQHGTRIARVAAISVRRNTSREHMSAVRGGARDSATSTALSLRVFVLCPLRRERQQGLYSLTRAAFVRSTGLNCSFARLRLAPPAFASQVPPHVSRILRKTRYSES